MHCIDVPAIIAFGGIAALFKKEIEDGRIAGHMRCEEQGVETNKLDPDSRICVRQRHA